MAMNGWERVIGGRGFEFTTRKDLSFFLLCGKVGVVEMSSLTSLLLREFFESHTCLCMQCIYVAKWKRLVLNVLGETAWNLPSSSRGPRRKLPGRILLVLMLWHVAFDGDCLFGHPVRVSLLADCISWCLHAGCHLSSSSMEASLLMESERTQSDSSSGITWSSRRRKSHSGMNSLRAGAEGQRGKRKGDWTDDVTWEIQASCSMKKTSPAFLLSCLSQSVLVNVITLECCLMTCRITSESNLVLKYPRQVPLNNMTVQFMIFIASWPPRWLAS